MIEQGTPEWQALRTGFLTASRTADMLATIKTGESASRRNLKAELVVERLTNCKTEGFTSSAMQWGIDNEPLARMAYEVKTNSFVDQVAFVRHKTIDWFGCSPDGLVDDDGMVEFKCPNSATHLEYLESLEVPKNYYTQMQTQLSVTGRKWNDFCSFDPRFPDGLQLLIIRVNWDEEFVAKLESEAIKFLAEVEAKVKQLQLQVQI